MALPLGSPERGDFRPDLWVVRTEPTILHPVPPVVVKSELEFEDPPPIASYISQRRPSVFDIGSEEDLHNTIMWRLDENRHHGHPVYGYQENITEPGQIPLPKLNILNEWWIDVPEGVNYALLEQYLWNPYNMHTGHLGRYHPGLTGGESRVVRAFIFKENEEGQKVFAKHHFVRDRRELAHVDSRYSYDLRPDLKDSNPKTVIGDYLFPIHKANYRTPSYDVIHWTQGAYGKIAHIGPKS